MPAAAVIPAPIAYIKVVAVKKLVVGSLGLGERSVEKRSTARRGDSFFSFLWYALRRTLECIRSSPSVLRWDVRWCGREVVIACFPSSILE